MPIIDLSPIRTRSFFWKIWRTNFVNGARAAGIRGSLSWYGISDWQLDPWKTANSPYIKAPGARPAGLGVLVYPPWPGATLYDGLISSVRWEATRMGLEDVEYFTMLLDRLSTLRELCALPCGNTSANACHPNGVLLSAERALNRVDEVVWGWAGCTWVETPPRRWNITEPYTMNTSLVHDVLGTVAFEIEKADRALDGFDR